MLFFHQLKYTSAYTINKLLIKSSFISGFVFGSRIAIHSFHHEHSHHSFTLPLTRWRNVNNTRNKRYTVSMKLCAIVHPTENSVSILPERTNPTLKRRILNPTDRNILLNHGINETKSKRESANNIRDN